MCDKGEESGTGTSFVKLTAFFIACVNELWLDALG